MITVSPAPDISWVVSDTTGQVSVCPLPTGPIQVLSGAAAHLWELSVEGIERADLIERTLAQFDDAPPEARDSLEDMVDQLLHQGLLTTSDHENGAIS